jgi:ferredoxin/flavodoxin---NADP+ reductase
MIGLPTENEETGELTYPQPTGVVEILTKRGFTLDHRKVKGNLHYEEYW